jgi:hypothetical protein
VIPSSLAAEISYLLRMGRVENPSDQRLLTHALAQPEQATKATVVWMEAVTARNGAAHPGHQSSTTVNHGQPPSTQA